MLLENIDKYIPPEGIKIIITLFLSFIIGIGREGEKSSTGKYYFGGIRTFPLLGLLGYGLVYISRENYIPFVVGLFVIGILMALSYFRKFDKGFSGFTTELAGLLIYIVGAIVSYGNYWVATTLTVISIFLLELKPFLSKFGKNVSREEMVTLTKFLLLSLVLLPIVPNENFTQFNINPFKIWVVLVAVSGISYGSYVIQKITKSAKSVIFSAILGGIYSSTMTTVVLSKKSKKHNFYYLYSGSLLIASSIMYIRILILIYIFNSDLAKTLFVPFIILGLTGLLAGYLWTRREKKEAYSNIDKIEVKNPLELKIAFIFALLFIITIVFTKIITENLGQKGIYSFSALMGITGIDPYILAITQNVGEIINLKTAAISVIIAAAFNNIAKGIYAWFISRNKSGFYGMLLLLALSLVGFLIVIFI